MRLFIVAAIITAILSHPGQGSTRLADGCAPIKDPDARAFCRAIVSGDVSHCSAIQDSDRRAYCRAVVLKDPSLCSPIKDANMRALCRADASRKASACTFTTGI